MNDETRIDFRKVISTLRERGLTQIEIATICDIRPQVVSMISKGHLTSPKHHIGHALVLLEQKTRNRAVLGQMLVEARQALATRAQASQTQAQQASAA